MRVLVTGSNGRIGKQLVGTLQTAGYSVRGFDLTAPEAGLSSDYVIGSLSDQSAINRALDGVDAVIHLAALMSWDHRDNAKVFDLNVSSTFHLLEACKDRDLTRFVFASSGTVYPENAPQYLPIDEAHPKNPNDFYGMTKLVGEDMVRNYSVMSDLPYTILRFSNTQLIEEIVSPNSFFARAFFVNAQIRHLKRLPPSDGRDRALAAFEAVASTKERLYIAYGTDGRCARRCICDVRDLCSGIMLGLEHPQATGDVFNIGPLKAVDTDVLVRAIADVTGYEIVEIKLDTLLPHYETSVEKARASLGFAPLYSVEEVLRSQPY